MAPPPVSGKLRPWNSHGPITDRVATIVNFQYCCIWTEMSSPFPENRNSVWKFCVQNTVLKALLWSSHLGADCCFASELLPSKAPGLYRHPSSISILLWSCLVEIISMYWWYVAEHGIGSIVEASFPYVSQPGDVWMFLTNVVCDTFSTQPTQPAHVPDLTVCKRTKQSRVTSTFLDRCLKLFGHICWASPSHNHARALQAFINNHIPEDWCLKLCRC